MAQIDVSERAYERRLHSSTRWALSEGERFFKGESEVQQALEAIAAKLDALGIAYTVVGGLALSAHGFRRFTEDVDLLVTRDGLKQLQQALIGHGYRPPFEGSKNLRDTEHGVRIEFLVTGAFPGDGKPKPVAFPDPASVSVRIDGVSYLNLETLVELKLASGMTAPGRMKDLSDVSELIALLKLDAAFAEKLNPFVREKYAEIWRAMASAQKRFVRVWRASPETEAQLQSMLADGVAVDLEGTSGDTQLLVTSDPAVAAKHGLVDEDLLWNQDP
jgi:hypothetical protein